MSTKFFIFSFILLPFFASAKNNTDTSIALRKKYTQKKTGIHLFTASVQ